MSCVAPCLLGGARVAQAAASPPTDPRSIWTIQAENDAVSALKGTSDQYYTSGLRVNWTSGTDQLPRFFSRINRALLGDGVQRMSAGVQQLIFTLSNTQAATSLAGDRPYAGVLLGTLNLINDTDLSRSVVGTQLGVMGPAAGGRQMQNGFHSVIGDSPNRGWDHQLRNQPVFQVQGGRIWRFPLIKVAGIETDIMPAISAAMGDHRIYGGGAAILRIGQGLDSDFGNAEEGHRVMPVLGIGGDSEIHIRRIFNVTDLNRAGHDIAQCGDVEIDDDAVITRQRDENKIPPPAEMADQGIMRAALSDPHRQLVDDLIGDIPAIKLVDVVKAPERNANDGEAATARQVPFAIYLLTDKVEAF
ncbi:MAG: lipid A deacylase LpxR family protein [Acetobacteraceae bacterium]